MRITREIAVKVVGNYQTEKYRTLTKRENNLRVKIENLYYQTLPQEVREVWEDHRPKNKVLCEYFGKSTLIQVEFGNKSKKWGFYINMLNKLPSNREGYPYIVLTGRIARTAFDQYKKIEDLKIERNLEGMKLRREVLKCRTVEKAIIQFPELTNYFNKLK